MPHAINASLKQEDTLQAILRAVRETPGANAVVIRLLNPNADALEVAASSGTSQALLDRTPPRLTDDRVRQRVLAGETRLPQARR